MHLGFKSDFIQLGRSLFLDIQWCTNLRVSNVPIGSFTAFDVGRMTQISSRGLMSGICPLIESDLKLSWTNMNTPPCLIKQYSSRCTYYSGWMSCLISFVRASPDCEEREKLRFTRQRIARQDVQVGLNRLKRHRCLLMLWEILPKIITKQTWYRKILLLEVSLKPCCLYCREVEMCQSITI